MRSFKTILLTESVIFIVTDVAFSGIDPLIRIVPLTTSLLLTEDSEIGSRQFADGIEFVRPIDNKITIMVQTSNFNPEPEYFDTMLLPPI